MTNATGRATLGPQVVEQAVFAKALLGEGLPPEAERHLRQAGLFYHMDDIAETHLLKAQALAPEHAAVLIGLYRFYFYKGRLSAALDIAMTCLTKAAQENNLPNDWRNLKAGDAMFSSYDDMPLRFFLFALKGYAYLQMRLGNVDEGLIAIQKLLELDPTDKIGSRVLLEVIQRMGADDDL
ncbi:MAG: hypothetical protein PHT60_05225 [Acidiphilium sp.]|nr:hypothetical protein [Acidiphilium sp.]MDD4935165.1 hypothetical protein [Acidiphilium sp.]